MLVAEMPKCVSRALILVLAGTAVFSPAASTDAQTVTLAGAGATFAFPLYTKGSQAYLAERGVRVTYQPGGSGEGIRRFVTGAVDFGGTDALATHAPTGSATGEGLYPP